MTDKPKLNISKSEKRRLEATGGIEQVETIAAERDAFKKALLDIIGGRNVLLTARAALGLKPWGTEPWVRAAGDSICPGCKQAYRKHRQEAGPGYGSCGDETLYLVRLCDGSLVHL